MRLTRRRFRVTARETEWAQGVDAEFVVRVEVIEARVAILDTERSVLEAELAERVQPPHEEEAGSHTVLRPLAVLSSALVVAVGFTGFPADAGGKPPGHFGVASGWRLPWLPAAEQARYLDSERAMGVQIVRFDVNWPSIQAGGATSYNWAPFDTVVQGLKSRGMDALGVIAYTPAWARPAGTSDKHAPTNVSDYANFCEATARHFAPLGVRNWEVWNEPNISGFFQPRPDVAKYTAMLKACYSRIKAVDPSSTVITGGNSPAGSYNAPCATACTNINPVNFLKGIYANGGAGYFDAVGHHPFSFPAKPSTVANWSAWYQMAGTTPSLRSLMIAHGDGAKKIWATEWGAPTNGPAGSGFVSEAEQASQVTEAFALFRSYTWAGPLFVHDFRDDGTTTDTRENYFGLIRFDFSQKPSYRAFRTAATNG